MSFAIASDGVEIYYESLGEGPRGIIFLHGWGGSGSGHSWRRILPHLDLAGCRAVLVDLRGHGHSRGAEGEFTVPRLAADVLSVAGAVGLDLFVVVGFSLGGKIAQWLACHAPERVAAQFLVAPLPLGEVDISAAMLEMWLQMIRRPDRFSAFLASLEQPPLAPEALTGYFRDCAATPTSVLSSTYWMAAADAAGDLHCRTAVPALVVGGMRDGLMRPSLLQSKVVDAIPGAHLVTLDCGHHIPLSRGPEVARLLQEFLAEQCG
jgi:3-oxoadipate enol-lactonase